MSFSKRLGSWFRGQTPRTSPATSRSRSSKATDDLEEFAASRRGVEAYLEPRTNVYSTTLLLVADDGEYLRRPVDDGQHASSLCRRLDVPLYEAAKVGYPQRLRDYERGNRTHRVELSDLPPWPGNDTTADDGHVDADDHGKDHRDRDPGSQDLRDNDPADDPGDDPGDDPDGGSSGGGRDGHLPG